MSMAKSITGGIGALVIGAVLFVAGGAIAIFIGKPILDNAKASESWPDVPGVVVSSDVVSKRGKDNTMYSADIVYHYAVNGRDYTCSTVSFGGNYSSSSSQHAHKVTNKYPAGTPVQVYYQPEEPSTAALEPGATAMSYFALGIGCVFVLVGGLMCAVPLFYLFVGGLALGAAATGMAGKFGQRSSSLVVGSSAPQGAPDIDDSSMADGITIQ